MLNTLMRISIMMFIWLATLSAYAQEFDPNSSEFDPDKQFVITPFGAIMGDPVQVKVLGKDKVGFTVVTVTPTSDGVTAMLSIIEPQQNGEPGGGHALMMSLVEVEQLMKLLNDTQNADVVSLENYGEHHKLVGRVTEPNAPMGEIAVLFNAKDVERNNIRIVHILGGTPQLFEFSAAGIEKLIRQIGHYVEKAETTAEATKL
ncbi:hypothetical protein [Lentilitoribacter sp. EG35]|uniref:hypothetical protein n=1 Tax=Lentilitoribacter sp. EG35 TaxID=3234192 RepID=UPI003460E6F7